MSRSVVRWVRDWCSWVRRSVRVSVAWGGGVVGRGWEGGGVMKEELVGGVEVEGDESNEEEEEEEEEEGVDSSGSL